MNISRFFKLALTITLMATAFFNIAIAQTWHTDYEESLLLAKDEKKPIILIFQGSDWCAPCIKLERDIWSSEEFKSHAVENYILLVADFPRKKKNALPDDQKAANQKLAATYNKQGIFPYVVVLDSEGNVKGSTGYKNISPVEYIALLESM